MKASYTSRARHTLVAKAAYISSVTRGTHNHSSHAVSLILPLSAIRFQILERRLVLVLEILVAIRGVQRWHLLRAVVRAWYYATSM